MTKLVRLPCYSNIIRTYVWAAQSGLLLWLTCMLTIHSIVLLPIFNLSIRFRPDSDYPSQTLACLNIVAFTHTEVVRFLWGSGSLDPCLLLFSFALACMAPCDWALPYWSGLTFFCQSFPNFFFVPLRSRAFANLNDPSLRMYVTGSEDTE